MEQEETTGNTEINTLTDLLNSEVFNVMYWVNDKGWAITDAKLSIEDARIVKGRYETRNQQARIFLDIE